MCVSPRMLCARQTRCAIRIGHDLKSSPRLSYHNFDTMIAFLAAACAIWQRIKHKVTSATTHCLRWAFWLLLRSWSAHSFLEGRYSRVDAQTSNFLRSKYAKLNSGELARSKMLGGRRKSPQCFTLVCFQSAGTRLRFF